MSRSFLLAFILLFAAASSSAAQQWRRNALGYPAYSTCAPQNDNICFFVSCPAPNRLTFELYAVEHGRLPGEQVTFFFDRKRQPLILPKPDERDIYRWSLDQAWMARMLSARRIGIGLDSGPSGWMVSARGLKTAFEELKARCG